MRPLFVILCFAAACSSKTNPAPRPLQIGSKAFTESVVLGEIAAQAARAAGVPAVHRSGLGGTRLLWNALLAGDIDLYPDYTGTLFDEILHAPESARTPAALEAALHAQGVAIIGPLGFSNSYALGMREDHADRLHITKVSQLQAHPDLRFGLSSEFMSRRDGWPSLRARYALEPRTVRSLDHDIAYQGIGSGALDVVDLYTTDAEIQSHHLRVLIDDLRHFPRYDAVWVHREDLATRRPEALLPLRRLTGSLSVSRMRALNAQVKVQRETEAHAAATFLGAAAPPPPSRLRSIAAHTRQHLTLVALSLSAALIIAVPLGVLAFRRPRFGQAVLALTAVVQTIPSLALLVFMVPLLGLGVGPAALALFLYSLLPIVRNTHAGLASIPPPLRESAEAMGLPPRAILWRIELPLASRAILAGIKSAAVINVGTATLGALVGAGGLGEPIFTGVRLDDAALILQGAVPASLLALAVQGAFDALERVLIPRGLRLTARG